MTIFDLFCRLPAIDCGDGYVWAALII